MNTIHRSLILGASAIALSACGADEIVSPGTGGNITINNNNGGTPTPTPTPTPTATLVTPAAGCPTISDPVGLTDSGTISGPTGEYRVCTLPAVVSASSTLPYIEGVLYRLDGRTDVGTDGGPVATGADTEVQLTIEPGVIVYATNTRNPAFLNVNRGNTINAVGTAERPIVFTSRDNVQGLNSNASSGQWGGVILSGRAPITDCDAPGATPGTVACERQVEGELQPALYGGATADDNSGRLEFVQIRFSGFVLSGDAELQALTTGGVGSGTRISNVMSFNSSDDGVEFFGGEFDVRNLVVVGAEDDSLDTDVGAKINMQNVIAIHRPGAGDTMIEADSNNDFTEQQPRQNTRISNATFIYNGGTEFQDQVFRIRGGTDFAIVNSVAVENVGDVACLRLDLAETVRAANPALDDVGPPIFESFVMDCAVPFRDGSGGVTAAQTEAIFDAGSNNNDSFANTLTMLFVNGSNENAVPVFDPTVFDSFFTVPTNIGAVYPGNDTWVNGWTCNSATVTFDANVSSCLSLPVYD